MKRLVVAMVLSLAACSSQAEPEATTGIPGIDRSSAPIEEKAGATTEIAEFWASVPTDGLVVKGAVDEYADAGDCKALQDTFDTWANARHFDGKADLLDYINEAMKKADCFK